MLASKSLPELDSERNPDQTPTSNIFLFEGMDVDQEDHATLRLRKPLVVAEPSKLIRLKCVNHYH